MTGQVTAQVAAYGLEHQPAKTIMAELGLKQATKGKRLAEIDFPIAEVSRHAARELRLERRMEIRSLNTKREE